MMLRKFKIEQSSEKIVGNGGLALVGAILSELDLDMQLNNIKVAGGDPKITNADVVKAYMGLLCQGRTAYEDIELYKDDQFFCDVLGIKRLPSCSTLRQRLDKAGGKFDPAIKEINVTLLEKCRISPIDTGHSKYSPFDMDVSPFDNSKTKKECVSRTYKGMDGYAPNFGYIGVEGHMVNTELRAGKQHSQKGTPEFLKETLAFLERLELTEKILLRADSGYDSQDNIRIIHSKMSYVIKRNIRKESKEEWLEIAKAHGRKTELREGKTVYIGDCYRNTQADSGIKEPLRIVFEVVVREITRDGQSLMFPEIEVDTYWVKLNETANKAIELYHDHGTSEQFHSELKTDMDVERLPSGKFATNQTVLQLSMLAFNTLRRIGQDLISYPQDIPINVKTKRKRLRKVLQDMIYIACKFVKTSSIWKIRIGLNCPWFRAFRRLYLAYT